jgi:hypothetical protein
MRIGTANEVTSGWREVWGAPVRVHAVEIRPLRPSERGEAVQARRLFAAARGERGHHSQALSRGRSSHRHRRGGHCKAGAASALVAVERRRPRLPGAPRGGTEGAAVELQRPRGERKGACCLPQCRAVSIKVTNVNVIRKTNANHRQTAGFDSWIRGSLVARAAAVLWKQLQLSPDP